MICVFYVVVITPIRFVELVSIERMYLHVYLCNFSLLFCVCLCCVCCVCMRVCLRLELIKKHKTIEEVLKHLDASKYQYDILFLHYLCWKI